MAGSSLDSIVVVGTAWTERARYKEPTGDKKAVFSFSVSTTESVRNPSTNEWEHGEYTNHYVTVFGKQAENCRKEIHNKDHVIVIGRNRTHSYEKDGEKRYSTDLIADHVGLSLYWARDRDDDGSGSSSNRSSARSEGTDSGSSQESNRFAGSTGDDGSADTDMFFGNDDDSKLFD